MPASDIVIGVGFLLGDALGDAAKANPNIKFVSVDGVPSKGHDESWATNGESLFFAEDQSGWMAGVLAASLTKSNHIGVVGGLLVVPPVERFVEGYEAGAKSIKPDIKVDHVYTTSFTDPPQGSNAATADDRQGCRRHLRRRRPHRQRRPRGGVQEGRHLGDRRRHGPVPDPAERQPSASSARRRRTSWAPSRTR